MTAFWNSLVLQKMGHFDCNFLGAGGTVFRPVCVQLIFNLHIAVDLLCFGTGFGIFGT